MFMQVFIADLSVESTSSISCEHPCMTSSDLCIVQPRPSQVSAMQPLEFPCASEG